MSPRRQRLRPGRPLPVVPNKPCLFCNHSTPPALPTHRWGGKITISYAHTKPVTAASIIPPTATTHSTNMMQRVVFLKVTSVTPSSVTVEMPKAEDRVVNPGWFMLWIMEGDVPCKEAQWIQLG